ncbi:YdbL family protein [Rheinheimera baltica]|uniref:YdbL family protein n=1 Tax=Rheinheimera baltica TaxID=67576 RepID=A0ABT9HYT6_9GAMM|nr:YdbL family protein [Rheinheimera baltica]MDP5136302.1 YdbL family protein [Rheinheimera baltica]MDP5144646.1 YdbL family protein [Rheinheimera baltica]MDP5151359.1 YdbL family protein [Rheinheimera baltica]MDP5190797.1 YdbL family protein [Rheinheimera baltica]
MKLIKHIKMLLLPALFALSLPVLAMNLQQAMAALGQAKAQGLVGEQANGYLGAVQNDANTADIVKLINDARRAEYSRLAQQNNIAVADVEAMAGKKALERTSAGHYILLDGNWVKKP